MVRVRILGIGLGLRLALTLGQLSTVIFTHFDDPQMQTVNERVLIVAVLVIRLLHVPVSGGQWWLGVVDFKPLHILDMPGKG